MPNPRFPDMKALADYIHAMGLKIGHLFVARPADLRRLRRQLSARGAGRPDLRRVGLRLPQVRLVLLRRRSPRNPSLDELQKPYRVMRDGPRQGATATSSTASASTAWATSGSGAPRSAATAGAPPATSPTPGAACRGIGFGQDGHEQYAGPGHWNDPGHARRRQGRLGPEPAPHAPDAQRADTRTSASGACSPRRC